MPEYLVTSGEARVRLEAPTARAALENVLVNLPESCEAVSTIAAVKHLGGDPRARKGGVVYFSTEAILRALGLWASDEATEAAYALAAAVAAPVDAPPTFSEIDRELNDIFARWRQ